MLTSHQYLNIVNEGQAETRNAYSSDYEGGATGSSHKYNCVEVEKGRKSLIGNMVRRTFGTLEHICESTAARQLEEPIFKFKRRARSFPLLCLERLEWFALAKPANNNR